MEMFVRLSKGLRRHIRQEKAAIRRQFNDTPEAREKIKLLIEKFFKQNPPDGGALKAELQQEVSKTLRRNQPAREGKPI